MENFAKKTTLKQANGAFGRVYVLEHSTAGLEVAGSGTRECNEHWASVCYDRDGTRHSKRYPTIAQAAADFNRWTAPIEEVTA